MITTSAALEQNHKVCVGLKTDKFPGSNLVHIHMSPIPVIPKRYRSSFLIMGYPTNPATPIYLLLNRLHLLHSITLVRRLGPAFQLAPRLGIGTT